MRHFGRWLLLAALMTLFCFSAALAQEDVVLTASLSVGRGAVQVQSTLLPEEDGECHWLFLPSFARLGQLNISCSEEGFIWPWGDALVNGKAVDVTKLLEETEEGVYSTVLTKGEEQLRLKVTQSANLRTLFFFSDDPVEQGREYIEGGGKHDRFTTGAMALVSETGTVDHADRISKWRGRGNSTWGALKKPYQFKLEYKADLLQTGIPSEQNRTWILRTDALDATLLRDKIAFDMGLEIGLNETSISEHVDLYYDGEYRGIYLLCEKVQVKNGRIEILDYDQLIENWNTAAEQPDLESLPVANAVNAYGLPYTYIEGLTDLSNPSVGGYLIEMEGPLTLSDKCHFTLSNGFVFSLKNPEYASAAMVAYVSEKMERLLQTLLHHGIDPETGTKTEYIMDLESFARVALVNEWANNADGYSWSSSYFILPEGEERFRVGPLWDFDLSFGFSSHNIDFPLPERYYSFKPEGWFQLFYGVPAFRDIYQQLLQNELYPCIQNVLLGSSHGKYLRPFGEYTIHIEPAMIMNRRLWSSVSPVPSTHPDEQTDALKHFIQARTEWFYKSIMSWEQETANLLEIESSATYLLTDSSFQPRIQSWSNADMISWSLEQLTEATEEDYAIWQFTAELAPILDFVFTEDTRVLFNGKEMLVRFNEDGTLTATVLFEDPSYKPVYAYDEDIGMVFNLDYYMKAHPDVAEEWDYDPVFIAEYFFDYGMEEGQRGNAFFRPASVMIEIPQLADEIGYYYPDYYWAFIEGAYADWMPLINERYEPVAFDVQATADLLSELGMPWGNEAE